MFIWDQSSKELLIDLVEPVQTLWNERHRHYQKKINCDGEWGKIARIIGCTESEATQQFLQLKRHYLRHKALGNLVTGSDGGNSLKEQNFFLASKMSFLNVNKDPVQQSYTVNDNGTYHEIVSSWSSLSPTSSSPESSPKIQYHPSTSCASTSPPETPLSSRSPGISVNSSDSTATFISSPKKSFPLVSQQMEATRDALRNRNIQVSRTKSSLANNAGPPEDIMEYNLGCGTEKSIQGERLINLFKSMVDILNPHEQQKFQFGIVQIFSEILNSRS